MKVLTRIALCGLIAANLAGTSGCIVDDRGRDHDHGYDHRDDHRDDRRDEHRCDGEHDRDECHH